METKSESVKRSPSPRVPDYDDDNINLGEIVSTEFFEVETPASSDVTSPTSLSD